MSDLDFELSGHGIRLTSFRAGQHKTICPQCSGARRKKNDPCLSVTIGPAPTAKGEIGRGEAVWFCHHCEWSGAVLDERHQERAHRGAGARSRSQGQPDSGDRDEAPSAASSAPKTAPAFKPDPSTLSEDALAWFGKRGISRPTLERNGVTLTRVWMPQFQKEVPVMAFPYRRGGVVVNVKYRGPQKSFRQEKDAEKIFCGLDDLGEEAEEIIIVEGEMDKLALNEIGIWNVLSVPDGAPAQFRWEGGHRQCKVHKAIDDPDVMACPNCGAERVIDLDRADDTKFDYLWNCEAYLARASRVILAVDADHAGRVLQDELARRIGKEKCWRVRWPAIHDVQRKDADEVLIEDGAEVLRECIERAQPYPIAALFEAERFESEAIRLYDGEIARGLSTGLHCLDELFTIRLGELSVITGFPSSGKSEFVDAIAVNLAMHYDWRFVVASFENPPPEHMAKWAQKFVGQPFTDGYTPKMGRLDLDRAMRWINEHFYFIRADDETPTIDWLLDKARAAVLRYGVKGLIIDPYNEIEHKRPQNMSETEYVSQMLGKVKRFLVSHDVHGWFVAHPTKPEQAKAGTVLPPPSLYSIAGSANWVNKADVGIVVHRAWRDDGRLSDQTEILVRKVRFRAVGRPGIAKLQYSPVSGRYMEAAS